MKKIISLFLVAIIFLSTGNVVSAKNAKKFAPGAEDAVESATYDVEGKPNMKVKVFVHKQNVKPGTGGGSTLVCDLPDTDSTSIIGDAGWRLPSSVSYSLNINSVPKTVGRANLATIVGNGFNAWTSNLSGAVNLARIANTTIATSRYDGRNVITWGTTSANTLGVTYVWYYTDTKVVVEVDTVMNRNLTWAWSNSATCAYSENYDAQDIMTHELGHWFGLDDEYGAEFTNNTMYGYGSKGEAKKNTPTTGDLIGLDALY